MELSEEISVLNQFKENTQWHYIKGVMKNEIKRTEKDIEVLLRTGENHKLHFFEGYKAGLARATEYPDLMLQEKTTILAQIKEAMKRAVHSVPAKYYSIQKEMKDFFVSNTRDKKD